MTTSPRPFYNSEPARIIRDRLVALHQMKNAEQIGKEIGYRDGKVVRSFAEGALSVRPERC